MYKRYAKQDLSPAAKVAGMCAAHMCNVSLQQPKPSFIQALIAFRVSHVMQKHPSYALTWDVNVAIGTDYADGKA